MAMALSNKYSIEGLFDAVCLDNLPQNWKSVQKIAKIKIK